MSIVGFFDQFPEYNGQQIQIRGADSYVSVKDLNKALGKRFADWRKTKFAKELLDELSLIYRIPIEGGGGSSTPSRETLIDHVIEGNAGIYVHPAVALSYAMSNARFQARVNAWLLSMTRWGTATVHHADWSATEYLRGIQFNRDDINDMYGR